VHTAIRNSRHLDQRSQDIDSEIAPRIKDSQDGQSASFMWPSLTAGFSHLAADQSAWADEVHLAALVFSAPVDLGLAFL
jgi:hypothetical protein